jgi:N-acetyl sugar amidotransferase
MDTTDPQIVFDQDGYCNHCTEFLDIRAHHRFEAEEGKEKLDHLIAQIKRAGQGGSYDCIVGMSGGVDSSYAANLLCEMGVRPLAVHMDNGWDSEESVSNIKKVTAALGIDYESYVLDWEEFRDLQLSFLRASVPEAETPTDVAIPAALHHFASQYKIKHIISAGNLTTEGILPKSWHYNAKDLKYLNYIHDAFGSRELRTFPTFDYKKETYFKLIKGVRIVYPLNYVKFSQDEVTNFLVEKFDYVPSGEKHHESLYTRFIQSYYLFEKFSIDYRRAKLSSEICNGRATREAALEELELDPYDRETIIRDKEYVAKKLQISSDEIDEIVGAPPKWHWDYPNDEQKLQFIYGLYLKLFRKEKLANF